MPMLTLVDVLAIGSPERERLVEADDAICDVIRAVKSAAERDGLDPVTVSRALVGVLTAAAARQGDEGLPIDVGSGTWLSPCRSRRGGRGLGGAARP